MSNESYTKENIFQSPAEDRNYIVCQDLFKIFKPADLEVVALRGLDLKIQKGELVAIVGSSGSGKTTLLNILAGLERPSAGQVYVGNRDMLNIPEKELVSYRRTDVGFVWQTTSRNLVPYLSVLENIELPMAISGVNSRKRKERGRELLQVLGMEDKQNRNPGQLSGGEQQRVAIAVALANQPPLLLADEPTGNLDPNVSDEILDLLEIATDSGAAVLMSTHNFPLVQPRKKRFIELNEGRLVTQ